jgi:hypothetical protein
MPSSTSASYRAIWRGVDEGVQGDAVRAHHDEVGERAGRERDLTAHEVVEAEVPVGHAEAEGRLAPLLLVGSALLVREVTFEVVVALLRIAAGGDVPRLDLLARRVALVQQATLEQAIDDVAVDVVPQRLPVRSVRAAHVDALVPVELEPAQTVEDLLVALLAVTAGIGVLDAEDQLAAVVPRVRPVEQGRADETHVGSPGGRGAEPHAHIGAGGGGEGSRHRSRSYRGLAAPSG